MKFIDLLIYLSKQLFETLFLIVRLLVERLLKPFWILIFLVVFILIKNWPYISKSFSGFGIPEYTLIKGYLEVFLSLPVAILVLGILFLLKFSQSIKTFLENSRPSQVGPVGVEQRSEQKLTSQDIENKTTESLQQEGITITQDHLQQIQQAFNEKEVEITNQKQAITYLLTRAELFEFAYLNLILVQNTKQVLKWFFYQPSHSSTKENFLNVYILPAFIADPLPEKEAIFNALLVNQLIEQQGDLFTISDKGIRFLQYLGSI